MMAAGGSDLAAELVASLDEAARLLEAGDAQGAAQAMAAAGRCQAMSPGALGPQAIEAARRLLDRCRQAEARLRKKLAEEMANLGVSRRAQQAYER